MIKEKCEKLLSELDYIIAQMKMLEEIHKDVPEIMEIKEELERIFLKLKLFTNNLDKKDERVVEICEGSK